MTRFLSLLALLSFEGECGPLFVDLDGLYTDSASACGLDISPVFPGCSFANHAKKTLCSQDIDALTCEQLSAVTIPESCRAVCQ